MLARHAGWWKPLCVEPRGDSWLCSCPAQNMWATPLKHPPPSILLLFLPQSPDSLFDCHRQQLQSVLSLPAFITLLPPSQLSALFHGNMFTVGSLSSSSSPGLGSALCGTSGLVPILQSEEWEAPLVSNWNILAAQLADHIPLTFNQLPSKTKLSVEFSSQFCTPSLDSTPSGLSAFFPSSRFPLCLCFHLSLSLSLFLSLLSFQPNIFPLQFLNCTYISLNSPAPPLSSAPSFLQPVGGSLSPSGSGPCELPLSVERGTWQLQWSRGASCVHTPAPNSSPNKPRDTRENMQHA